MGKTATQKARKISMTTKVLISVLVLALAGLAFVLWHERVSSYGRMTSEIRDSELFEDMQSGKSVCFIGDSITEGTETRLTPWYRPMERYIEGDVSNFSHFGWTTSDIAYRIDDIPAADIYIFAIGINDILFQDIRPAATTPEEYTENLDTVISSIRKSSPDAKIYFIAPWPFVNYPEEMTMRREAYSDALHTWCDDNGFIFIDPTPFILSVIEGDNGADYMKDDIHPNRERGCGLYSYAVLDAAHRHRTAGENITG